MLKVNKLHFGYGDTPVLSNISFTVKPGEHFSIIGESGSGKSTLLKLIYGELNLNKGEILWRKTPVLGPNYNLVVGYNFIKYVSQEFDLMPFTTVSENIGAFLSNFYPEEKQERITALLKIVELEDFAHIKVKFLSGGQKQRVAIAKALAKPPEILLLDEPFSHIDNFKKQSLRRNLFNYLKTNNIACIVATHDKDDVLPFSNQMLVLHEGKALAKNTPNALYKQPKNEIVAAFFGEFNTIENQIVYAHQLKIVPQSPFKVIVLNSYFKGHNYVIEGLYKGASIFFENQEALTKNTMVCLTIKT